MNWLKKTSPKELKEQLPHATPKPYDSILQPGKKAANLYDFSHGWEWKTAVNWKQPGGPDTFIEGKDTTP